MMENTMTMIFLVEDKTDEQDKALAAIRKAFAIADTDTAVFFRPGKATRGSAGYKKEGGSPVMVLMSGNLGEFREWFNEKSLWPKLADPSRILILTDLMFPANSNVRENLNGIEVLIDAVEAGSNIVVCSDADHHDVPFMPRLIATLEKSHPKGKIPVVLDDKNWEKALGLGLGLLSA
jgi:hypothetical protein